MAYVRKKEYVVTKTMPNGKREYFRGKTKKEAIQKRDEALKFLAQGSLLDPSMTFQELAAMWLGFKADERLHTRTMETITGIVRRYINPAIGDMCVLHLKPVHIRRLMHTVSQYSQSTQKKVLQYTKSICEFAVENNLLMQNPCVPSIKPKGPKPEKIEPLSDEQCSKLLTATKGTRAYLFVLLCLYCGLRRGEALGLMWKDIDFQNRTLTVNRSIVYPADNHRGEINTDCKTEAAHRTIPIVSELYNELLRQKRASTSVYVISMEDGRYLTDTSFKNLWALVKYRSVETKTSNSVLKKTIDFEVHPHQLRHTCATRWVRSGMDVSQVMYLMGHTSVNVTLEIYTHYQEEIRRNTALAKMERMQVQNA